MLITESTNLTEAAKSFLEQLKKIEENQREIILEIEELNERICELEEIVDLDENFI